MIRKLKSFWNKHVKYRKAQLTPKGECFKRYCEQISNDILENEISSYEDFLWYLGNILLEEYDIKFDREEVAEFILMTYEEIL